MGSGSTVVYAVQHLARVVNKTGYKVTCVPTSFQSRQLILEHGLILSDLSQTPEVLSNVGLELFLGENNSVMLPNFR